MANTLPNDAAFYLQARMCYGNSCREIEIPWVRDFALLPKGQDIAILSAPFGKWAPGLYVRPDLKNWHLALNFNEVCELNLKAVGVEIRVYNQSTTSYDDTYQVYRNSFVQVSNALEPSPYDIWAVVKLAPVASAGSTQYVSKVVPAATSGVVQVSATARNIVDWTPSSAGLMKVNAAGVASIATAADLEPLVDALPDAFE